MSRRSRGAGVTTLILGLAATAATVFSGANLFRGGPAGGPVLPRIAQTLKGIGEGFGRGIRTVRPDIPWVGGWETEEGVQTLEGAQTVLEVTNLSGVIRVIPGDQDVVSVHYTKQARTQADLEAFVIEIGGEDDTVFVRPLYTGLGGVGRFGAVELEITVPARIRRLALRNTSGDIRVEALGGPVDKELRTVSGDIQADGEGNLAAHSVSGDIAFTFRGERLELGTTSGAIRGTLVTLGAGGGDVRSVSGDVEIAAPGQLDAVLDLASTSGDLRCDLTVSIAEQTRRRLKGTLGSGGVPLKVHTTSGDIRITRS